MAKVKKVKLVCDKCGKQPPVDEKNSNKNWIVHDVSKPCECGGKWKNKLVFDE